MKINAIIPCGGVSTRAGLGYSKLKYNIGGMPLLSKTLSNFCRNDISKIIIACTDEDRKWIEPLITDMSANIILCKGGDDRTHSIYNALLHVEGDCDYVIIHDGARPFVKKSLIDKTIATAMKWGNAIAAVPITDSLRIVENDLSRAVNRSKYWAVQTPQVFATKEIKEAYETALKNNRIFSDDASLYEAYIGKVYLVEGDSDNTKITYASDLSRFVPNNYVVGVGWDTHELVDNRKLIIGGIEIPHNKGLAGHSDADVLTHAIIDAILSASHNPDIGNQFPDTDEKYKNISSLYLLEQVLDLITSQGYIIGNISATIMAQKPKLSQYIPLIQEKIAEVLKVNSSKISITATTTEKLGLIGHEEAISANAYCALYSTIK